MMGQGWTTDPEESLAARLLHWQSEHPGVSVRDYPRSEDGSPTDGELEASLQRLYDDGYAAHEGRSVAGGISDPFSLTSTGRALLRDLSGYSAPGTTRNRAAREALLYWFYEQRHAGVNAPFTHKFVGEPGSTIGFVPLSEDEVARAAGTLKSRGDIRGDGSLGHAGPIRADITEQGEAEVEGSRSGNSSVGSHVTTHFHAPVHGQVAVGDNNRLEQTVGVHATELVALLDHVREATQAVPPGMAPQFSAYVDVIQAEAESDEPDPSLMGSAVQKLRTLASKVGDANLTGAVGALWTAILGQG